MFPQTPLKTAMQHALTRHHAKWLGKISPLLLLPMSFTVAYAQIPTQSANQPNFPANSQSNNPTAKPASKNSISPNPTIKNDPNYQYQIAPNTDLDRQFLLNQPLPVINNFDKPVATLTNKSQLIGYDKNLGNAKISPNTLNQNAISQNPTSQNLVSQKAVSQTPISHATVSQNEQQVKAELNDIAHDDTLTQTSRTDNSSADAVPKDINAIHETDNINVKDMINPNDYLPDYKSKEAVATEQAKTQKPVASRQPNVFKNIYDRLLNRGNSLPRAKVDIVNADEKKQPAANIKAALEQVTVESIEDFPATLPRLRQIANDAAEAVGYYDTEVSFQQLATDRMQVTVDKVGEPVKVTARVVDIRGEGGKGDNALPVYEVIEQNLPPQVGEAFNHGTYKQSKATIENVAKNNGFFDAKWLNSSADIVLPDNSAEVDLIYDTQTRYNFDDVKFYSIDKKGNLTDDPDKLPIKPKLLKQLMAYDKGDPYFQPHVTHFSNNLLATRYFNGINVDVVLPPDEVKAKGTLNFDTTKTADTSKSDNQKPDTTADNHTANTPTTKDTTSQPKIGFTDNANQDPAITPPIQNPDDIAPLQFSVDDTTKERLSAVKQKARNLLNSPEDIQLAEDANNSKSPLAKIANAISAVAKKLDRPDDTPILLANASQENAIEKKTPDQVYDSKAVPTYVVLNATKPREAQVGIGYETDKGVRVVAKIENNLVNRNGYQAGLSIAASKSDQQVEITGSYPYKHPLNDKLIGSIGYEHKSVDDINNAIAIDSLNASIARNIKKDTGWNRLYSIRYRYDELNNNVNSTDIIKLPPPFNNTDSKYSQQALLVGYALNKTVSDNVLNPTQGYSQHYSVEAGAKGLLTDTNIVILRAGLKGLYSFGGDNKHQVLGRADLGYIYSDSFYDVPYKLRFFAGGDQSLRGYATDSQSPEQSGYLLGGRALATGSLEYNYEFRSGFRGALFADVGNAYDFEGDYGNKTKVGIGTGIRWASPIGLVRLDVAAGLSDKGTPIKLYLFIGSPL